MEATLVEAAALYIRYCQTESSMVVRREKVKVTRPMSSTDAGAGLIVLATMGTHARLRKAVCG